MGLLFITGSEHKFAEARAVIPELVQKPLDLTEIQGMDAEEIMRHKLQEARKLVDEPFIVEDTAFFIDALNGFPGPLVKWFHATVGLDRVSELFAGSKAHAEAIIGYWDGKEAHYFSGRVDGTIVRFEEMNGFGFDTLLVPDGWDKTFAEGTLEEKNEISHRGRALQKLKAHLAAHS